MKKLLFILSFVLLFSFSACSNVEDSTTNVNTVENVDSLPVDVQEKQVFTLSAKSFAYVMDGVESPDLKVKLGDTVRIDLSVTDGFHDFVIDEFSAATDRINAGESTFVEFVADKAGTFEYYCSIGAHRAAGMFGKFIVE